jgi:pimeloyl-ACP methyl ester carboxylesterase
MLTIIDQWFKKPRWKELEKEFIEEQAQREYLQFEDSIGTCKVYYLTNPLTEDHEPTTGETFVGIHGTGGSSLSFLPLIPHLPLGSRFYFIDLPGFGKSHTTHSNIGTEYYVECLRRCMETLQITQVRFIAHSFGAFITIQFASAYPSYVKSLTLVTPVGLFPTLNYNISLWMVLFQVFRFPYFVRYVRWLIRVLYTLGLFRRRLAYTLSYCNDYKSDLGTYFASFMPVKWRWGVYGYWGESVIAKLLCLPAPVHLVFGQDDPIVPAHQGLVVRGLRSDITVDIIPNEQHYVMDHFPKRILQSTLRLVKPVRLTADQLERFKKVKSLVAQPERYASYFSFHQTWLSIQRLYVDLLTHTI